MQKLNSSQDLPDFILKSTLGVSLISILLITPFCINNFIQGRALLGILSLVIVSIFTLDAILCYRGHYHKGINLYGVAPILVIGIAFVVNEIGVTGSYWAYLGVLSFYFILPKTPASITNIIFLIIIYPIAWNSMEQHIVMRFGAVLAGVSVYAHISMTEISKQHLLLKEKSVTDVLTGLYNRSLLQSTLEYAIYQSNRANTPMTLFMLDLDNFKEINDDLGHGVGDTVLKAVGDFLLGKFRSTDMVFRIGGEEFLVLIHNTDEDSAFDIADRLRRDIEQLDLLPSRSVTVSIGVSTLPVGASWEEWMKACDEKLYRAKSNGRNQVIA